MDDVILANAQSEKTYVKSLGILSPTGSHHRPPETAPCVVGPEQHTARLGQLKHQRDFEGR
jgi:hypothetical protein